jgi:response regulator RpfG family c-di-GMP phosphodiesterase
MLTLLLVDDEPLILKSLQRLFRGSACTVLIADNPADALKILNKQPVDILVTDYQMMEMTGAQLVCSARKIQPRLSAVILTCVAEEIKQELRDEGTTVMSKPWNGQALLNHVFSAVCEAA